MTVDYGDAYQEHGWWIIPVSTRAGESRFVGGNWAIGLGAVAVGAAMA
jgi:hypothetical protein